MVLSKEWNAYKVGFGTRTNAQFTKIPEILNSYPILKDVSFIKSVEWGTSLMWLLFETTTLSLPSRMTDHQSLRLLVALQALGTEMKLLFDLFVSESSLWTVKILRDLKVRTEMSIKSLSLISQKMHFLCLLLFHFWFLTDPRSAAAISQFSLEKSWSSWWPSPPNIYTRCT